MRTLNLIDINKSDIQYTIHQFPDGHKHIELKSGFNKENYINVVCRINNGDDLFILIQVNDILSINDMRINELSIKYLFTARCDRRFSIGEAYDLKIIGNILQQFDIDKIKILDIHSQKFSSYIRYEDKFALNSRFTLSKINYKKYRLCFPDEGAFNRLIEYMSYDTFLNGLCDYIAKVKPIICNKIRKKDLDGNVRIFTEIKSKPRRSNNKPILVVDDLCDGGGTFISVAKELRELNPPKLSLFVTHAIQLAGIEKVSKVYDEVYITNSYNNWENEKLPNNVIVIDII